MIRKFELAMYGSDFVNQIEVEDGESLMRNGFEINTYKLVARSCNTIELPAFRR